jgi:hypothetical protein
MRLSQLKFKTLILSAILELGTPRFERNDGPDWKRGPKRKSWKRRRTRIDWTSRNKRRTRGSGIARLVQLAIIV